jgi:hypothetical protein
MDAGLAIEMGGSSRQPAGRYEGWRRCLAERRRSAPAMEWRLKLEKFNEVLDWNNAFGKILSLANHQRLSRVAEGTGPMKPQQPGAIAKVLIPAQWGEIRSSIDRSNGR